MNYNDLLITAIKASIEAGEVISEVYKSAFTVEHKEDKSPLTLADTLANEVISKALKETQLPILSEEGKSINYEERKEWKSFWMVDPLDGTKEFIKRNGEFTVNIALIENNTPVMGVIFVPEKKILYFASHKDGSYRLDNVNPGIVNNISYSWLISESKKLPFKKNEDTYKVVGSRSHMSEETVEFINTLKKDHKNIEIVSIGSSLKLCLVAEGIANIYPRFGPTYEWDTAAGHAIVEQSGSQIFQTDMKTPLKYNKADLLNPWFIVKE